MTCEQQLTATMGVREIDMAIVKFERDGVREEEGRRWEDVEKTSKELKLGRTRE